MAGTEAMDTQTLTQVGHGTVRQRKPPRRRESYGSHGNPAWLLGSAHTLTLTWFGFTIWGAFADWEVSSWWLLLPAALFGWAAAAARDHGRKSDFTLARFDAIAAVGYVLFTQAIEDLFGNCI